MREMKDSWIEWVGKVPATWKVMPNKYIMTKKKVIKEVYDDENIISLSMNGVIVRDLEAGGKMPKTFDGYQIVYPGNLLMCLFDYDVTPRCIGLIKDYGVTSPAYSQFVMNNGNYSGYYYYYYLMVDHTKALLHLAKNLRHSFTEEQLGAILAPVPTIEEQHQIVHYLDTQCSEIDATAEDIQKEISLLEDYKKSVITEAVTKGLNPDAEMKDSGIEWIGEIPKDWVTIRIGNVFSLRNERNYLPMEQVQLLSLYSGKGVFPTGEEGTTNSGNHAQTVADYKIVKKNDIVVNIILAWMGSLGISNYNGVVSPAYDVYISNEEKVVPHYYHYVFRTSGIANECYRYGRGIMMMRWRTYSSEFKRIHVPFPPLEEQQQIADYLDSKCSEIDSLIADKKRQLDILADYKKSLIYEYVTGKKEVPVNDF